MMVRRLLVFGQSVACLLLLSVTVAAAQETPTADKISEPAALESFIDRHVARLMAKGHVPGVTVSVVRGNETVLVKSYGVRNRQTKAPVDPEKTLFRIGSVTKLMTTIVILGLVDDGILDLDVDINTYLKTVKVPDTFADPVTLRHILTHMGGFKDTSSYLHRDSDEGTAMSPQDMQRMLGRARAPGQLRAYDNTAFGLLGVLIADVTGKTYRDVVRERIFIPLGMENSVIGLPKAWQSRASQGHGISLTDPHDRPVVKQAHLARLVEAAGAGSSTAADMAKFMKALMNDGVYEGGRLLRADTFQAMMDFDANRAHPMTPSLSYTIYESDYEGRRAIGHGGLIDGFATELAIFPEANLGVFISSNVGPQAPPLTLALILEELQVTSAVMEGAGNAMAVSRGVVMELAKAYVAPTRSWGRHATSGAALQEGANLSPDVVQGRYVTGGVESGVTLATRLFLGGLGGQEFKAVDGVLTLRGQPLNQVAPGFYSTEDGSRSYAFQNFQGHIYQVGIPIGWSKKVSVFTGPLYTILPLIGGLLILLTALVYWFPVSSQPWRRLGRAISLASIIFIAAFVIELQFAEYVLYVSHSTIWLVLWRLAINLALLSMLIMPAIAVMLFMSSGKPASVGAWARSIHMALLVLACLAVFAASAYWGIVGAITA